MHETAPITRLWVTCEAETPSMAFITYSGDVPMSPYIIPKAMINPAAVTLLVGIFTFREVVVFLFRLARRSYCKGGYRLFNSVPVTIGTASKGISKNQSEPLNGKIFAAYKVFGGDKLCRDAVCPFFINHSCNAGFECICSKIKEKILTGKW